MTEAPRRHPAALISWSHSDPEWLADQIDARRDAVLELTNALRRSGIDADVDLFHLSSSVDWSRWGPRRVAECDFVLVIVSAGWRLAWEGRGDPRKGAGAAAEADVLRSAYAVDRDAFLHKVRLVLLPGVDSAEIPDGLHGVPRFRLMSIDGSGLHELFRNLTDQPEFIKAELGDLPKLPPAPLQSPSPSPPSTAGDATSASPGEVGSGARPTPGQCNASVKARDYLRIVPFSARGLVDQLVSDGFSAGDAEFAVADAGASWEEQAGKKADVYLSAVPFSRSGLTAQLVADGFDQAESESAVARVNGDWGEQAEKKATQYLAVMSFSQAGLVRQLVSDGFTEDQAQAAVVKVYQ